MFLQNVWYAAWWINELDTERLLSRSIAGQTVVFWRDADGTPHAILDRCPHRAAPLSLGRRVEQGLECGYHGLVFNASGRCVANPHGPTAAALHTRSFPLAERHNLIWIWMGLPAEADAALIPDLSVLDRAPPSAYSNGYMMTDACHLLISDNILDLTHADYLHPMTLGGGSLTRSKPTISEAGDDSLYVEWLAYDETPQPIIKNELPDPEANADIWLSVRWYPNGVMLLRAGATNAGRPREEGIDSWNLHIATPEAEFTTHYFFANTREYRLFDEEYNRLQAEALHYAFSVEDKTMLEAQQRNLGRVELFDANPVLLSIDVASSRARRIIRRLEEKENQTASRVRDQAVHV